MVYCFTVCACVLCVCFSVLSSTALLLPPSFSGEASAHTRECKESSECNVQWPCLSSTTVLIRFSLLPLSFLLSLSRIIIRHLPFCFFLHAFSYCFSFASTLFVCLSLEKCPTDQSSVYLLIFILCVFCSQLSNGWHQWSVPQLSLLNRYSLIKLFTLWHCNSHLCWAHRFLWCHSILKTEAKC